MDEKVELHFELCEATLALLEGQNVDELVERALVQHLEALHSVPADVIVQPRLVATPASAERIRQLLSQAEPTPALIQLLAP